MLGVASPLITISLFLSSFRRNFTPLHWACEARDAAKLRALLRRDGAGDLQVRARARYTALQLAQISGPPVNAPVSEEVLAMTRAALSPWEPAAHGVWPLSFRRGARTLMLVSRRLLTEGQELLVLPNDVWLRVLSFCSRTWFIVDDASSPQCAVCGAKAGNAGGVTAKLMQCPCARVYYCGAKHQLEDWKRHKRTCSKAKKSKKNKKKKGAR